MQRHVAYVRYPTFDRRSHRHPPQRAVTFSSSTVERLAWPAPKKGDAPTLPLSSIIRSHLPPGCHFRC